MNVVAEMLLAEPTPAVIWLTLVLLTVPAMLVLGSPHGLRYPGRAFRETFSVFWRGTTDRSVAAVAAAGAEAVDAVRFAEEVRVAADRAAVAAERWEQRWLGAEDEQAEAWQAWLDADARLRAGQAASAFGLPWSVRTCAEYASRERFLHRSVAEAVERGDLPVAAVADALAGHNGWDARLHPLEQELVINRAAVAYRRHRYDLAVEAERVARHDTEVARRSLAQLRPEAIAAEQRAADLRHLLPAPGDSVATGSAVIAGRRRLIGAL